MHQTVAQFPGISAASRINQYLTAAERGNNPLRVVRVDTIRVSKIGGDESQVLVTFEQVTPPAPVSTPPTFRALGDDLIRAIERDIVPTTPTVREAIHAFQVLEARADMHGGKVPGNAEPRNAVAQLVRELEGHPCRQYFTAALRRCRAAFRLPTYQDLGK